MSNQALILAVILGLVVPANLLAAAQNLTGMAGIPGLTTLEQSLLRQAREHVRMATEETQSRKRNAPTDSQFDSVTVIEGRTNIAVGKGSVACASIGGFDEPPACVAGDDENSTNGRAQ